MNSLEGRLFLFLQLQLLLIQTQVAFFQAIVILSLVILALLATVLTFHFVPHTVLWSVAVVALVLLSVFKLRRLFASRRRRKHQVKHIV